MLLHGKSLMPIPKLNLCTLIVASVFLLSGCATPSIPMEDSISSLNAKKFNPPPAGRSGVYIFRNDGPVNFDKSRFKRRIWIDSTCLGKSASNIFFYTHVPGGISYTLGTESVLLINKLTITLEPDQNYFFEQFVHEEFPFPSLGRTSIRQVSNFSGESKIGKLKMASLNSCQ